MTRPFYDPVIYPGMPFEPAVGAWTRTTDTVTCAGGEVLPPGRLARWAGDAWECRDHVGRQETRRRHLRLLSRKGARS